MAERSGYQQWPMTVVAVRDVAPHLRRVTFGAPEFADFALQAPDESFGLMMPLAGREFVMPEAGRLNARSAIQAMPVEQRPELRWYSVRALRPEAAEMDADLVLHGDAGPGSAWAERARPGETVGFRTGTFEYRAAAPGETQLLVADETAAPALAAIVESQAESGSSLRVVVEAPDDSYLALGDLPGDARICLRGSGVPGSAVLAALRDIALDDVTSAWVCGESGLATGVRRFLTGERGLDRARVMFSGYWKQGRPRL